MCGLAALETSRVTWALAVAQTPRGEPVFVVRPACRGERAALTALHRAAGLSGRPGRHLVAEDAAGRLAGAVFEMAGAAVFAGQSAARARLARAAMATWGLTMQDIVPIAPQPRPAGAHPDPR